MTDVVNDSTVIVRAANANELPNDWLRSIAEFANDDLAALIASAGGRRLPPLRPRRLSSISPRHGVNLTVGHH